MLQKGDERILVHSSLAEVQYKNLIEIADYYKKRYEELRKSTTNSIESYNLQVSDLENQNRVLKNKIQILEKQNCHTFV